MAKKKPSTKPRAPKPELPLQQERFAREYLVDCNATQAAIRAGYSPKTAAAQGVRLLRNVKVAALVSEGQQKASESLQITSENVLKEIANLAFSDIGDVIDFATAVPKLKPANQISPAARRCISSVKVRRCVEGIGDDAREVEILELRLWPKNPALQDLARHLGILKPPENNVNVHVSNTIGSIDDLRADVLRILRAQRGGEPATAPALAGDHDGGAGRHLAGGDPPSLPG